jgi:hypothetical protein
VSIYKNNKNIENVINKAMPLLANPTALKGMLKYKGSRKHSFKVKTGPIGKLC